MCSQDLPTDLANFDLTQLESIFDKSNDTMDVEEDVASWLDSLCANNATNNSKPEVLHQLTTTGSKQTGSQLLHLIELNGNTNGDLSSIMMSRGDPLMGSANNMRQDLLE